MIEKIDVIGYGDSQFLYSFPPFFSRICHPTFNVFDMQWPFISYKRTRSYLVSRFWVACKIDNAFVTKLHSKMWSRIRIHPTHFHMHHIWRELIHMIIFTTKNQFWLNNIIPLPFSPGELHQQSKRVKMPNLYNFWKDFENSYCT